MGSKKWIFNEVDEASAVTVAAEAGLLLPIARILTQRGWADQVDEFLSPRLALLADPSLLPGIKQAAERIWASIDRGEVITVFGDYDVDGVTSTTLLVRVLSVLGATVHGFIPDRMGEGYGLTKEALDRCLAEHASSLVITVDCGTNAVESVQYAQQRGVDVIITDHHEPDEQTAEAFTLINPKLGTVDELEHLSGVGVAFKLAHGLVKHGRSLGRDTALLVDLRDYLDIAALGTVADIVPLVGENRIIVRHGMMRIAASKWVGLEALKKVAGVRGDVEPYHLGFQLGPRINAAGRIGQPMQALQLLITEDRAEARSIAELLDETNTERRSIEKQMADEAFAEIDEYFDPDNDFGLVVAREGWHPGVVGIVASRVSRHYNRPAVVMGIDEDGSACGSCRSIAAYNLLEGLQSCERFLARFGGHTMAAGVEVHSGMLEEFKSAFNDRVKSALKGSDLVPVQQIDSAVSSSELDWEFFNQMQQMQPFGQDNPEPVFALMNASVSGSPRVVGQGHLKLRICADGNCFDAIAFGYPLEDLPAGLIDVAFVLKENNWNGNSSLQLQIKDIRPAQ